MRLGYVDESGTEAEEGWFILSAFIIDVDEWTRFDRLLGQIPPMSERKLST